MYEKVLVRDVNTLDKNKSQMEQWSILSDNIVYVRPVSFDDVSRVDIKMVDYGNNRRMYKKMGKEEGQMISIDFGESPDVLKAKYMDVYEDVFAEVVTTNRFDENVDLSTTYLGKIYMKREDIMKVEESFPISEQGFVIGKVLKGEECQILLDTCASKSYMSKSYYLSRSIPLFPREQVVVKPGEKKLIPIETPFVEEILGIAIVKIIDKGQKTPMILKLKFIQNKAALDIMNNTREILIFDRKTMIGILDLRSLGYYKIRQGVLQQNLNKYYHFEEANKVCEEFNKMVETVKQEEKGKQKEKYPWLDYTDERKYMMDKEILEKYIDLRDSCLDDLERKQVMEMLYDYKDVFSLRDEIGMCPNIEVNIEVTDNSPFFIRPYHVKGEDRAVLDKEMRRLCYLGILKEGFSAICSPVKLISRKMTSNKRVVTDFRHLNMRIAKNNLAYPLFGDTFALLGSSKC